MSMSALFTKNPRRGHETEAVEHQASMTGDINNSTSPDQVASSLQAPVTLRMDIRLERDDALPAIAGFLRCEEQHSDSPVMYMNVQMVMAPEHDCADGSVQEMTRDDRKRLIITSLMHEFGHVLESYMRLPVNEEAIEKACADWEAAYMKASRHSQGEYDSPENSGCRGEDDSCAAQGNPKLTDAGGNHV